MQLVRAEQRQHHQLVEIGAAAFDADLLAHGGMAAVAADDVVRLQNVSRSAPPSLTTVTCTPLVVLRDGFGGPAEARFDVLKLRHSLAQDIFA